MNHSKPQKQLIIKKSIQAKRKIKHRSQSRSKQQLLSEEFQLKKEFGGAHLKNSHAKKARPISTKQAMHLTLRSSKAKGSRSFLLNRQRSLLIEKKVHDQARKFGVKIYRYANVGNHLHLLVRATHRREFTHFLRSISGLIARIALRAERGAAKLSGITKFWDQRPWTRILNWSRDFENVKRYVELNFNEAMGFLSYKPKSRGIATLSSA